MILKSLYNELMRRLGFRYLKKETPNIQVTLEIYHYRNGKLLAHVKPYVNASLLEKFLFHISSGKIVNLTRSA